MENKMFQTDIQTLKDLEMLGSYGDNNVASLFNETVSKGGESCLMRMMEMPLTDVEELEERKTVLQYLAKYPDFIEIDRNALSFIEIYLQQEEGAGSFSALDWLLRVAKDKIKPDNELNVCRRGVEMLGRLVFELDRWVQEAVTDYAPEAMQVYRKRIMRLVRESELRQVLQVRKMTLMMSGRLDFIFRQREKMKVRELMDTVYEIEALRSVARAGAERGFVYPEYVAEGIEVEGLVHPFLQEPVANDFRLTGEKHICFLTGPNMAGKSTYMKSLGIAVYLAHLGFPVPAARMRTAVFKGLFTTINLSDNINLGYSHYYSEVRRVKYVAQKIAELGDVVVVFDELFRGTNVKDASDASLAVISAFAELGRSRFVISTHILEVAEQLQQQQAVDFRFFEIENRNGEFHYTYRLKAGVSNERIGMYILRKEKVVETIKRSNGCH